jgi:hypothetical protein
MALTAATAAGLVAIGPVAGTPPAEAAVVLEVIATPSSGLDAGDQVVLTVPNLDATSLIAAGQCDASILDAPDPFAAHLSQCTVDLLNRPSDNRVTRTVVESFAAIGLPEPVHCGDGPGDCVMYVSSDAGSIGFAPIDVVPSALAVAPTLVTTRVEFHAWASGEPGAVLTIAQCAAPVAATLDGADCPVTVPLTLDGTGHGHVTLDPVLTIATAAGTAACRLGGCALASFDAAGAQLASVAVIVLPHHFVLDAVPTPAGDLVDGQEITVEVAANTTEPLLVGQCAASVAGRASLAGGPCRDLREVTVPPAPEGQLGRTTITYAVAKTFVGEDGTAVDCSPFGGCVMAVDTVADDDASLATRPIEFEHPPPAVTTSDTTRLLDRQVVTIDVTGLHPDASFIAALCDQPATSIDVLFARCAPPASDAPIFIGADADGNLHAEFPVAQAYTNVFGATPIYCRDQCRISLFSPVGSIEVPYTMSRGRVTVSPSRGLADGQTVTLTGRRLMATYPGPTIDGVATGQWIAYQCAGAVRDDPSLAGVARNCVTAPVPVTVPRSGDVTLDLVVRRTIQPPQGPAVDCTRRDSACRVALHRLEQDGTTTLRSAPIRFRRT